MIDSYAAEAAIRAGLMVEYATVAALRNEYVRPVAAVPAADVVAIATAIPSSLNAIEYTTTAAGNLDGAVGILRIPGPAQRISFNFDASADWDSVSGELVCTAYGENAAGEAIHEDVVRNNAGAVAVQVLTGQCFSRVSAVHVGAGIGAGGLLTVGTSPTRLEHGSRTSPGFALYTEAIEPSATATVTFDAHDALRVLRSGRFWAVSQGGNAIGDPVFIRNTINLAHVRGELYGIQLITAGSELSRYLGATWITAAAAGGLAIVEVV
jgi:hypothetical protein